MKKLKKGRQLKLTNSRNAGRKAIHDVGIRHRARPDISRPTPVHLTVKLIRADIKNKQVLKILKHAIRRGRLQGLRIVHFSLEHDHVHLYAEVHCQKILGRSMKALGVTIVKGINKLNRKKGSLYKYRYHLRVLKSASDVKNVINYVLKNGIKHGREVKIINPYNSALGLHDFGILKLRLKRADIQKMIGKFFENEGARRLRADIVNNLDAMVLFRREMSFV